MPLQKIPAYTYAAIFCFRYFRKLLILYNQIMDLKKYSKWIFVCGVIIIYTTKYFIRYFVPVPRFLQPIVDVTPNFVGCFLLPFGAYLFTRRYINVQQPHVLKLFCVSGLILVIINEYLQKISVFGRTFDYLDILASFPGIIAGYIVFVKLSASFSLKEV